MARLMLVDGNSLAYRAFFALPTDLATAAGQVTNAVLGFTQMLTYVVKEQRPDGVIVAFDRPEPTFRHGMVEDYKAGREAAPDILKQQMGLVRQVLESLRVPIVEIAGFEADDVIATLATQARDRGDEVIIVTGDRDSYQLVEDPYIRVLYNKRGVSDYALYDEAGIKERTGVTPELYPQYAALRGDPSDNLPGVPGVGEKTAAKLINEYGGLDGIFANLDKLTPKLRENLAAHEDSVRANAEVIPLIRDVELPALDADAVRWGGWDEQEVRDLFAFLEFRGPIERLFEAFGADGRGGAAAAGSPAAPTVTSSFTVTVTTATGADDVRAFTNGVAVVGAWEGRAGRSPLRGLALAAPDATEAATWVPGELLADAAVVAALNGLMNGAVGTVTAADAKTLLRSLMPLGIDLRGLGLDVEIAAYLIDPAQSAYDLNELAVRYLGLTLDAAAAASQQGQLLLDDSTPTESDVQAKRAVALARLIEPLSVALEARGLSKLYDEIERPLVRVLARMEVAGIAVDREWLHDLSVSLTKEVGELEAEIHELAGGPFKVNSTPQLREVLFDKLGLVPSKRTKTGFSTDAQSLEKLVDQHPIIPKLLRWREVEKLRNTYGETLAAEIAEDGRIHASFNQTVARTGRLSSESPNLHNIPVRSDEGRQFRRAFVAPKGCRLLVADYNQIELRVIAHLSGDPGLTTAFKNGDDIHATTAARIYGVDPKDVTVAQRSKAKMVSYGLAYGMESYGLAQRLAIPVEEASVILNAYFKAFPAVKAYMDNSVKEARDRGYTETLFGRRRPIPELSSPNFRIRQAGERQAMNAGIQGLAADIFKVALVALDQRLEADGLASRIVLQVHDEIILEVPKAEEQAAEAATLEAMRGAAQLDVPLEVNVGWGTTWADAK
ncbi:MAG TPA: DNA polymerase I [Acidimicrobiales bacterium]|nr:DNA polymerase I [Acidimicrobiales bacterium]